MFATVMAFAAALLPQVSAQDARLVNLSSRGAVGTGSDVMIAGFVIGGTTPKDVLVRAVGPGLAAAGVKGALSHARLQVYGQDGKVIATNDQ